MKFLILTLFALLFVITPVFAEQVIFSEGIEYEISGITEKYKISKYSHIVKTQGFTTTGEIFFLRVSDFTNFEKVMILNTSGHWQKAEMREKIVEDLEPQNSVIPQEKTEFHYLLDQYDQVYNKENYKLFVKTFDKSTYSGSDFNQFQGKISGAKISAIIIDPNGEVKANFEGLVENGLFEGSVLVQENLWQRGWYVVDLVIEFEGKFYPEQLTFYVLGETKSDSGRTPPVIP